MNIKWSNELHLITSDSISPESYDADALRKLLKSMIIVYRDLSLLIEKIRFICSDKEKHSTLASLRHLSKIGHEKLKNFLPHRHSAETLFRAAQEMEGVFRCITSRVINELDQRHAPDYLQKELISLKTRFTHHCEHALTAMGSPTQLITQ